jgi:hypothetical protein
MLTDDQISKKLADSAPQAKPDAKFLSELRGRIEQQARELNQPASISHTNNYFSMFMNKILVSALVVVVVLVAGGFWYTQRTGQPLLKLNSDGEQLLSGKYGVTALEEESFGDLAKLAIVANGRGGNAQGNAQTESQKMTAPGMAANQDTATAPATGAGGGDMSILPYPGPAAYTFKYTGTELTNLPATVDVLKRTKPVQPPSLVSRVVNLLSFGLVDLSRFTDVKLQYFSFAEDRDYGYAINVDLMQGVVSLSQNWEKWPQLQMIDHPSEPVKESELPTDEEAIVIAGQFLATYGVSLEAYGKPMVNNRWRVQYDLASASEKIGYYIPEQVQVVYPLVLEGNEVLDEDGQPSGLSVMIDARSKRVVSIYDLTTKQFEKSQYAGVIDSKRLIERAEQGGFRNYPYYDPNASRVELQLDTPTQELVKIWYSTDNYRTNNELYVPALVFPIKNWEKSGYWRQSVIVPLVKDILDSDQQPPIMPLEQPMPVDVPVSSPPSGGSTEPAVEPTM